MKKYKRLTIELFISMFIHLLVSDFNLIVSLKNIIIQLVASWLISYVFTNTINQPAKGGGRSIMDGWRLVL